MFYASLLIMIGVFYSMIIAQRNLCGRNEVWVDCKLKLHGTTCPQTCESTHVHSLNDISCTKLCESGCQCKDGYLRNPSGECIHPAQCNITIPIR